jgi:hypothetical protein
MILNFGWEVIRWKNLWEKNLYPTANIFLDIDNIDEWVYKCLVFINKIKLYNCNVYDKLLT